MKTITIDLGFGDSYDFLAAIYVARNVAVGEFHIKVGMASKPAVRPSRELADFLKQYLSGQYAVIFFDEDDATMFRLAYRD